MNSDLLQGFYLRDLFVNPVKGQITGRAGSVHLPPKAMEVLLCLASNPGTLVTRETLIDDVWGAGSGSHEALSHAVSEIRHALNDRIDKPEFVQTLPKRGYRLIVEVETATAHASKSIPEPQNGSGVGGIGLFENLKQRGVLETALAYLVLGWLLIQIADIVFSQLLLPVWAGTFVTFLVIAGFPIAIVLSWFLEYRDGRTTLHELSPRDSMKRRFSRTYLSVIGALAIAAVVVFIYDKRVGLPQSAVIQAPLNTENVMLPPVQDNSIAVLPFFNLDGSDETEVFSNGLAEDLITRLSRVPGLLVSSRGDSFTLDPNSASSRVRERLRVGLYLEGSVQIDGDLMRVIVQLIDSETGFHVLSRSFDRPVEGFFEIRDEITKLTVANVRVALPAETQPLPIADYEESDLDAYVLYRRGKEIYEKPRTLESLAEVIRYFEQALDHDSGYAAAHAGLCKTYVARYELSNSVDDIGLAENACSSALASNSRLYMVHTALGDLYHRTGRSSEAEAAYNEALTINPQEVQAMSGLADVYRRQQKHVEAEQLLHTAIGTQPGNWRPIYSLGGFLFSVGRYEEAADAYRQVVLLNPRNYEAREDFGSALIMAGDFEAGKLVYEESLEIEPSRNAYSNLGVIYYYLGEYEKSVATHLKAVDLSPDEAVKWLNLADAYFLSGQKNEAANAFRKAKDLSESRHAVDPTDIDTLFTLAWAQQMLGEQGEAKASIAKGLAMAPNDPYGLYYEALINVRAGEHALAVKSLRLAVNNGYPANMLAAEPYLNELRANTEFRTMISETQ